MPLQQSQEEHNMSTCVQRFLSQAGGAAGLAPPRHTADFRTYGKGGKKPCRGGTTAVAFPEHTLPMPAASPVRQDQSSSPGVSRQAAAKLPVCRRTSIFMGRETNYTTHMVGRAQPCCSLTYMNGTSQVGEWRQESQVWWNLKGHCSPSWKEAALGHTAEPLVGKWGALPATLGA